jgi:DNA helicase-2/ATP-dependent DNA helicase PcrA
MPMLDALNQAQREAVLTEAGPLLVLAGAGTGKTRVVTYRIARLISRGIRPERILAVTFTNKAANEMKDRVRQLLAGEMNKAVPEISTFHSLCVRILRRQIHHLGYPTSYAIYDTSDQETIARRVLRDINVPGSRLRPSELLHYVSRWKTASVRPTQAAALAQTDIEHLAAAAYRRYQKCLKASGAVDFDDLLLLTEELFQTARIRTEESSRFDHVLIDEYQDTNCNQYRIVRALSAGHRNLCVVGDDDQSIYGWRGADVSHILRFRDDWPDAKVVRLEENYRSTDQILSLANRLIRCNKIRHEKTLRAARMGGEKPRIRQFDSELDEARQTVTDIRRCLQQPGREASDFAILFRTNEQTRPFETELRSAGIRYTLIGGMSFYDRKEVRDLLAYLRLLASPDDEPSLLRVLNVPPRGIGQKAQQALLDEAVRQGTSAWKVLPSVGRLPDFSHSAAEQAAGFVSLVRRFQARLSQTSLANTLGELIREIDYQAEIRRQHAGDVDAQEARLAAVQEVVNSVGEYESESRHPTLVGFLDKIALGDREADRDKEKQLKRNAVVLMTLHSAKGLEFPHVYMVGMEEGILPHHRSLGKDGTRDTVDEERRLCYVGITRAQERLTLSLCLTRRKWGKPRPTDPSRFLFEITGQARQPRRQVRRAH